MLAGVDAFQPLQVRSPATANTAPAPTPTATSSVVRPQRRSTNTALFYEPKWKKKATLAETVGPVKDFKEVGLKGTVSVVFKQGNETKTTMALAGLPLRDAAIQAGQFIKYGCGKGECGTCECLVDGQWIRPCSTFVPDTTEEYLVQVKEVKNKAKSSGKFYSVRSFLMGFYNNLLGMVGFVKYRRNAKKNWEERREYEDLVRQKTLEKKRARAAELTAAGEQPQHK